MKKIIKNLNIQAPLIFAFIAVLASWPLISEASMVVRTGDFISVASEDAVEGDFYALGQKVVLSGLIKGDSILFGGEITVNGEIEEDLIVVSGTAQVHAKVDDDLRIIAGDTVVAGEVIGDLVIVSGTAHILSTAKINGDVLYYGNSLIVEGEINGSVFGAMEKLRVDGPVGAVDVKVGELTLGDKAKVSNNVRYVSSSVLNRSMRATVAGEVIKNDITTSSTDTKADGRVLMVSLLVLLFASLVLYLVARTKIELGVVISQEKPFMKALWGMGVVIFAPIAIAFLLVSLLGSLIGITLLLGYILLITISILFASAVAGGFLQKFIMPNMTFSVVWVFIGGVILHMVLLVPYIGSLIYLTVLFIAVGVLAQSLYLFLRRQ